MGSPSTVNKPAETVAEIIHAVISDVAVEIIFRSAISELPFLGLPIVKQLFHAALKWLGSVSYVNLAKFATVQIIAAQTAEEKTAYAKAEGALRAAHLTGDPNEISKATAEFKRTLGDLIHYDGSFTP